MSKIFYPTSEKLKFLLESVHNREVALPDFQRDFVWQPGETELLIESICQNFPAGSLLRIHNTANVFFEPRELQGARPLDGHKPSYLILDGQQRLTSLYQALYGAGLYRYFINLQDLLDGKDLEEAVFFLRKPEAEKHFKTIEQQAKSLVFPFELLFRASGGFEDWLDQALEVRTESPVESKSLKQLVREVKKTWLQNVEDYEFPMVTLSDDTTPIAICTIFETLNRTGVKLSVFDLLVARFWPKNVRLRDLWQQAIDKHPIIGEFEVDPYYILQAVSIITSSSHSGKRADVLKMEAPQINKAWEPVVSGLVEFLHLLRTDCGVVHVGWLPNATMLITGASILAETNGMKGPDVADVRNKLKRWFWCAVFGQAYEKAANTQTTKDYTEILQWIKGGQPPETVGQFSFEPRSLREVKSKNSAVYRGVIALILSQGARDFHTGERITASLIREKSIDDHHVFPQAFLTHQMPEVAQLKDCVLNRTLIDKETNIRIKDKAPSKYLAEIIQSVGPFHLSTVLESHLLPSDPDSPLSSDKFEAYLNKRQQLIVHQVNLVAQ